MSETKKVSLTTLGPKKIQKKSEEKKSVRINLTLTEPTKQGCPMFDYENLIKKEKEKAQVSKKKSEWMNGNNNPFGEDDDEDVAKLAKQLEDKYNDRRYTYAELGAGYDESDSFIDNTDICEEELTNEEFKRYKGFYINKWKFESGSDTEKKGKRRRRSTAHSESDSTSESRSKKKYKSNQSKTKKSRSSVQNGSKIISDSSSSESSSSSDSESERSVQV